MAAKKKADVYTQLASTSVIAATSRASVKVADSYYTVEYHEERVIPDVDGVNLDTERELLWDAVNKECDDQVIEIMKQFKSRKSV